MNVCIYAKKKQKKYSVYFYCVLQKKEIKLDNCMDCDSFQIVRNKGIRKVSKKKINVKKEIYEKVIERDNYTCRLCGSTQNLQLHHIMR